MWAGWQSPHVNKKLLSVSVIYLLLVSHFSYFDLVPLSAQAAKVYGAVVTRVSRIWVHFVDAILKVCMNY